ncbi:MAG TPA: ABC transporter ATP-binding protein [Candidatus Avimonoglobus intestinipullorum]|uniref:ABC transporter ATP-binding protein n=1 Tax=Candidatus Avimonoglobus intestinipullorum TaxID=2840699 RepID=A0A9D1LVQ1_9FIRM|nr:ABC transporter ATP-binding protein [Candidatus Avimonoglobus intestinipullorum]
MNKPVLRRLLSYTKPYMPFLFIALACAVVSVWLSLLVPVLIGNAIDLIVDYHHVDFEALLNILLRLGLAICGVGVFQWLQAYFTNIITYRTVKDLRNRLFEKLSTVPLKYIDGHSHGDLISRAVNDIDQVSDGLLQGFTQLFTGIVTIVGTLIFMLQADIAVALVVILLTPLSLFVAAFIAKGSFRHFRSQTMVQGELSGYAEEFIGNMKLVKCFGYERRAEAEFDTLNQKLYVHGQKAQFFSSLSNPSTRFVNSIVYAAVGVFGAVSAINGGLSVGNISMFLSYANQYTKPFNEITGIITQLQTAFASAQRVFAVLDEPSEQPDAPDAIVKSGSEGAVTFKHVDFSYRPDQRLIQDLNLNVAPGSTVAIVGPTGCGKTTLINLLLRFYDVTDGSIEVDGTDIRRYTRAGLRSFFGMVLQETWLFSGTIRENISYGSENATDDEILKAAKITQAHSFIRRLPQGYDTVVSESGGNLSQGQKQLLCIARVMLRDPDILILDEATSNIDTRTELLVQEAFIKMMEGRTSFVVAHRLSTIQNADVILVMRAGQIVEQGRHEELLEKRGFYYELYNSQFAHSK